MPSTRKRFLLPREHGAWAQMAMPLLTGLALGRPTAPAGLFAGAAALAFLAHEPALVLLGSRGPRAREDAGPLARRQLIGLGALATAMGAAAMALAPGDARLSLLAPAALASATLWNARRRVEMTTLGEAIAGAAMASALLPVALSTGVPAPAAIAAFVAWALSFSMAAVAVEAVMAQGRTGARELRRRNAGLALGLFAAGFAPAAAFALPWIAPLSLAPTAIVCVAACLGGAGPGVLRRIGWALVGSTTATLLALVFGLRGMGLAA
jgi:hypothetical protein